MTRVRTRRAGLAGVAAVAALALIQPAAQAAPAPIPTSPAASHRDVRVAAPARVVSGWIPYWQLTDGVDAVVAHSALMRDASLFWYRATRIGGVRVQDPTQPNQTALDSAVSSLQSAGVRTYLTVTDQGFSAGTMATLLSNKPASARLVNNLVAVATSAHADGIDIDFEHMNFGVSGKARTQVKELFPLFLARLQKALHASSLRLLVSLPARNGPRDPAWNTIDYRAISPHVDRANVMTYDVHTGSTAPGPIAPLPWVRSVATYAAAQFGRRLSLGLPSYGYTWYLRTLAGRCPAGVTTTTVGSIADMRAIAVRENTTPTYVKRDAEFTFSYVKRYVDGGRQCRARRVVWFEDARSVNAKIKVMAARRIRSVAYWTLADVNPASWAAVSRWSGR
jgi:spore germination protein YaaH